MKLSVRLYRVAKVRMDHLRAAAGITHLAPHIHASDSVITKGIIKSFGPMAPGMKVFCAEPPNPNDSGYIEPQPGLVGMEMIGFDLPKANAAMAGVVRADPINEKEVDRLDGALQSELSRWGIYVEVTSFETRMAYEKDGN